MSVGSMLYGDFGFAEPTPRIAAFDLDMTLIKGKRRELSTGVDDWEFLDEVVPDKL